ncbi:copper resistance protein [Phenylobacterium zucineum HLK1]|jgi:methionine-rich copper-binding protein CopC|uniref:Copper resistance protein n=1 Tax=Phenylobacterium zucineum (strain HLK1) TaxID=450851 RepID=B4RA87_PHEZH|nr:copper homeostasis periplasmic binding protein CopC [Phenylobacterium zucineum]ACG77894.1 copper resistance protein [Phenylobacterium zucineum HLK1]
MTFKFQTIAALAGTVALAATSPAWAHARLVSSDPAANATLSAPPKAITLTFNEKLIPAFSKFELTMPEHGGMKVAVKTAVSKDGKSITGAPQAALTKGAYKIIWSAATGDGHKMSGEVAFKVG